MSGATDVLLLAAFPPELAALREAVESSAGRLTSDSADFCGVVGELEVVGRSVGVGLVAAGVGSMRSLSAFRARAVIVVGTCGFYEGRGLAIGDVVRAHRMQLVSTAATSGLAGVPAPMTTSCEVHSKLSAAFGAHGARLANVATTLAVTTDDALARQISNRHDCDVEHLEAFAVAAACAELGAPLAVVLGVANRVGSTGREEWKEHHTAASRAACAVVLDWLVKTKRRELPPERA